jgi:hypothetical protein
LDATSPINHTEENSQTSSLQVNAFKPFRFSSQANVLNPLDSKRIVKLMKASNQAFSSLDTLKNIESIEEEKHYDKDHYGKLKSYHALNQAVDEHSSSSSHDDEDQKSRQAR